MNQNKKLVALKDPQHLSKALLEPSPINLPRHKTHKEEFLSQPEQFIDERCYHPSSKIEIKSGRGKKTAKVNLQVSIIVQEE